MNNYLDYIMTNNISTNYDSDADIHVNQHVGRQVGGYIESTSLSDDNDDNNDVPNGGFPPVFIRNEPIPDKRPTKNLEYVDRNKIISLKDILGKKKL